jgi:hypothetical protein
MLFKLGYTILRLDIHSKKELKLSVKDPGNITIEIRPPNNDERSKGHKSFNAMCDTIGEFEPTKKALPVFKALLEGKRPPVGEKAETAEDMLVREGPSYGIEYYPNPFVSFVDKVNKKLSNSARTAISFIRWRYAQEGPPAPISSRGLSWSNNDGKTWYPLPGWYSIQDVTAPSSVLKLEEISMHELSESISLGLEEPVYHELLREAKELKFKSSRSSILISISAAEVAVKGVIYKLVPNSQWLIENVQSPPIIRIIKDYFPQIVPEEKYSKIKKVCESLTSTLEKAIFIRNRVAHRGESPPEDEKVESIIQTVEQLLWVCDYCSGYEWSVDYINSEMKNSI